MTIECVELSNMYKMCIVPVTHACQLTKYFKIELVS